MDPKSRDDILAVLRGLQALYCNPVTRGKLFALLESGLGSDRNMNHGRLGMPLWSILVLANGIEMRLGPFARTGESVWNPSRDVRTLPV